MKEKQPRPRLKLQDQEGKQKRLSKQLQGLNGAATGSEKEAANV